MQPQPQQEVGGYAYSRFSSDGNLIRQVQITRQHCVFLASDYTRWADLLAEVTPFFTAVLNALPEGVGVGVVGLEYVDKFYWRGAIDDWSLAPVLNQTATLVPPHIRQCTELCHSHHGYFSNETTPLHHRRLDNINLNVNDEVSGRVLLLNTSHKAILSSPLVEEISEKVTAMQTALKAVHQNTLKDILQASVLARIELYRTIS